MINIISFVIGVIFLIILTIIDIKTFNKKKSFIPSALTTLFLVVAFIWGGTQHGTEVVLAGIFAGLIALLLTDLDLWNGVADFKCFIAVGFLLPTMNNILYFALILTFLAVIIKFSINKTTKGKLKTMPFIPVILLAFIIANLLI